MAAEVQPDETAAPRPAMWRLAAGWLGLLIVAYALTGRPHDQALMRGIGPLTLAVTAAGASLFVLAVAGRAWRARSTRARIVAALALASAGAGMAVLLRHPATGHPVFPHRGDELAATRLLLLVAALLVAALSREAWRALIRGCRRALPNAALLAVSVGLGLLGAEAAVRVVRGVPLLDTINLVTARTDLIGAQPINRYDPTLGWVLADDRIAGPGFSTGQYGVRMNRDGIAPVPHHAILAVGDSFTAGSEVANAETWPAQLEDRLRRPVVNAANGGYGADQIVLRAEQLLAPLEPSAVVVSFLAHDIIRASFSTFGGGNKPWFTIRDGALIAHNLPVERYRGSAAEIGWTRRLFGGSHLIDFVAQRLGWRDRWMGAVIVQQDTDFVAVSCRLLQRLHRATGARGIPLHFVLQYQAESVLANDQPSYAAAVVACARADDIATLDSWDDLRALAARDSEGFKALFFREPDGTYGHMTPEGNHFVADLVATQVGP